MSDNGNRPAHPVIGASGAPEDYPGLTKREAFAMAVDVTPYTPWLIYMGNHGSGPMSVDQLAAYIAQIRLSEADALLVALDPTP